MAAFKRVLVFELSKVTFDVSILLISGNVFEVLATNGDTHLTGKAITQRGMKYFIELYKEQEDKDIRKDLRAMQKLRREVEKAISELTDLETDQVEVQTREAYFDEDAFSTPLTRAKFEELTEVVNKAGLEKEDIHEIVLVGGSTRIPKVQQLLKEFFNGKEPSYEVNPNDIAYYRAAIKEKKDNAWATNLYLFGAGVAYSASGTCMTAASFFDKKEEPSYFFGFLVAGALFSIVFFIMFCSMIKRK